VAWDLVIPFYAWILKQSPQRRLVEDAACCRERKAEAKADGDAGTVLATVGVICERTIFELLSKALLQPELVKAGVVRGVYCGHKVVLVLDIDEPLLNTLCGSRLILATRAAIQTHEPCDVLLTHSVVRADKLLGHQHSSYWLLGAAADVDNFNAKLAERRLALGDEAPAARFVVADPTPPSARVLDAGNEIAGILQLFGVALVCRSFAILSVATDARADISAAATVLTLLELLEPIKPSK
jgi:hypothetical protein